MNRYENPFYRLQLYYSWFFSDEYNNRTIALLAEESNIPVSIIRDDFFRLMTACPEYGCLNINDEELEEGFFEKFPLLQKSAAGSEDFILSSDDTALLKEWFLSGALDHVPFVSFLYTQNAAAVIHLMLEPEEYAILARYKEKLSGKNASLNVPYLIKESCRFRKTPDLLRKLDMINNAIDLKRELEFSYSPLTDPPAHYRVRPLKILYYSNDDIYCLLALYSMKLYTFRVDRISSQIRQTKVSFRLTPKEAGLFENALALAPNVWNRNFMQFDPPTAVKIRFSKIGNVERKVRADLACRTNGRIYEDSSYLYYEDIIYGSSSFIAWLNSFGRAAIVLEPESLQKTIMDSLQKQLEEYAFAETKSP